MIARAALGRPWLFSQIKAALRGENVPAEPTLDQQRRLLRNELGQRGQIIEGYRVCPVDILNHDQKWAAGAVAGADQT